MRLIDADALKTDLTRFYDNEVTAKRLIDEQPTITAIPVEWIMKWSNKRYQETQRDVSIVDVLVAWQKEQEVQDG